MAPNLYNVDQISKGLLLRALVQDAASVRGRMDDMVYATNPTQRYDTEGTFAVNAALESGIGYTTGAVAGNRARVNTPTNSFPLTFDKNYTVVFAGHLADNLNVRHFIGGYSALPTAASPSVEPAQGTYFRAIAAGAAVNWFAVSRSGGVETAVDTGILADVIVKHVFMIKRGGNALLYFIDGIQVASIVTNVTPNNLFYGQVVVTDAAVAKTFAVYSMGYMRERP